MLWLRLARVRAVLKVAMGPKTQAVPVVLLAAQLMTEADAQQIPAGTIIYNLEQIRPGSWAERPGYQELLRRHTVWDCDARMSRRSARRAAIPMCTMCRSVTCRS